MKASVAVESWRNELSIDYYGSLELSEVTDLRIVAQSLRDGLGKYIFEDLSYLREIDPFAWQRLHGKWLDIHKAIAGFLRMINNYSDWLQLLNDRKSRMIDPLTLREMVNQKSADTENIIAEYGKLVGKVKPIIEEALVCYARREESYVGRRLS